MIRLTADLAEKPHDLTAHGDQSHGSFFMIEVMATINGHYLTAC